MRAMPRAILLLLLLVVACGPEGTASSPPTPAPEAPEATEDEGSGPLRLYTSVSQETLDPVLAAFAETQPDVEVELFRAPTGELNARLAAERREGAIQADVLWLSDPLSMQAYAADGLLRELDLGDAADAIPAEYRTDEFVGTALLEVVIVHAPDLDPVPTAWEDLTDPAYQDAVAIPDPGFAGSAFGALGWFALEEGFGLEYYQALADNGAVQVQAPGEVITGVAEGRFAAGISLAFSAQQAIDDGSPLEVVYPEPGAIAVYSPVAIFESAADPAAAAALVEFLVTAEAQALISETSGNPPVRTDVDGAGGGGPQVSPDWQEVFGRQEELLEGYRAIFGG